MSLMKRFAESVAEDMGKEEIDEEVLAEAQRRLDTMLSSMIDDSPLPVVEDGRVKFIPRRMPNE